jgi:hypothetical protein
MSKAPLGPTVRLILKLADIQIRRLQKELSLPVGRDYAGRTAAERDLQELKELRTQVERSSEGNWSAPNEPPRLLPPLQRRCLGCAHG